MHRFLSGIFAALTLPLAIALASQPSGATPLKPSADRGLDLQPHPSDSSIPAAAIAPITLTKGAQDNTAVIIQQQAALQPGDVSLDGRFLDEYTFVGRAGQPLYITVESLDFDPFVFLFGPDAEIVAENDDISTNNLNSAMDVTLPTNGNYTIVVSSFHPGAQGQYNVRATTTLGTGDLQATLRWNSIDDLDLVVMDPSGEIVAFDNPAGVSGGQLDVDANALCQGLTDAPVENIFWLPQRAPRGEYVIGVSLYTRCANTQGGIPFTLTLTVQGTTETFTGTVDEENNFVTFTTAIY